MRMVVDQRAFDESCEIQLRYGHAFWASEPKLGLDELQDKVPHWGSVFMTLGNAPATGRSPVIDIPNHGDSCQSVDIAP